MSDTPGRRSRHAAARSRTPLGVPARLVAAGPRRLLLVLLGVVLVGVAAVVVLTWGGSGRTPVSPTPVARGGNSTSASPGRSPAAVPFSCRLPAGSGSGTSPVRLCIPAIRVDTDLLSLGLNADRTVEVPPLSQVGEAGWYRYSAAPGTLGPTVLLGHVDSAQYGEGVFFRLSQLHTGDLVEVARSDGQVAHYRISAVQQVAKSAFPSQRVYGPTSGPAIRLVTCGGRFDSGSGNYVDNIIAYGALQSLTPAA